MQVDGFPPGWAQCLEDCRQTGALSPSAFYSRKALREASAGWHLEAAGLPTLYGARVRPLGHQLYAARRVLHDRLQRFILADEVGLGKTIETGLILQALWHQRPGMPVLVIAPGSMVRQWWRELYLRFGSRVFTFVDISATSEQELRRRLDSSRLIVSMTALGLKPGLCDRLAQKAWQTVVVDEAHHLNAAHPLYGWVHSLCRRADHVLVLSATPSRRRAGGLAALLSLVAPDEYSPQDEAAVEARVSSRRRIWESMVDLEADLKDAEADLSAVERDDIEDMAQRLDGKVRANPRVVKLLKKAAELPPAPALDKLHSALAYAREVWRLDNRIIRTRRSTLDSLEQRFSQRILHAELIYEAGAGEMELCSLLDRLPTPASADQQAWISVLHRVAATTPSLMGQLLQIRQEALKGDKTPAADTGFAVSWQSDPGPVEEKYLLANAALRCPALPPPAQSGQLEEMTWLKRAAQLVKVWSTTDQSVPARHRRAAIWLQEEMAQDPSRKFLVFTQDFFVVEEFADHLQQLGGLKVRCFHHMMGDDEQEEAALDFTSPAKGVNVLVCDELGGEGRNFQEAWAVLHLDLPLSPMRLEQRIGRIDRIGRPAQEPVRSVVLLGPSRTEQILHRVQRDVFGVYTQSIGGLEFMIPGLVKQLQAGLLEQSSRAEELLQNLKAQVESFRQEELEFSGLELSTSKAELLRAMELAKSLENPGERPSAIIHWLRALGVKVERDGLNLKVQHQAQWLDSPIPGVEGDGHFRATLQRKKALEHEAAQFLQPGHRLVDGALTMLEDSLLGRFAFFRKKVAPRYRGRFLAMALLVDEFVELSLELPAGMVARARGVAGRQARLIVLEWEQNTRRWSRLYDPMLLKALEEPFSFRLGDEDISDQRARLLKDAEFFPSLGLAIREAVDRVSKEVNDLGMNASKKLERAWKPDLAYYQVLLEEGEEAERQRAKKEMEIRRAVLKKMASLSPRLDALAIVTLA